MTRTKRTRFRSPANLTIYGFTCLITAVVVCISTPLFAGVITGSYQVDIGESERLLEAQLRLNRNEISQQQFNAIEIEETCMNPSARLQARNRPALMLLNTSASENEILSFTIDLEEVGFGFGTGDVPTDGFLGSLAVLSNRSDASVTMSVMLEADTSMLTLNFSGLSQGAAAIFRIDLDPTPVIGPLFPDYRGILLGADVGDGPTSPALILANFGMDDMETATNPTPFNGGFEEPILNAGGLEGYHSQSISHRFGMEGGTSEIPEPSTAVLMLLAGVVVATRRQSKQQW